MIATIEHMLRAALGYLPSRSRRSVARRLTVRANAARDARSWQVASAFYEEALRLAPNARIHKQCGHMFKEAGQFVAAEQHYREAERLDPDDPDLALQIGHFEKIRGDLAAATLAYRRALALEPGWAEPRDELAILSPNQPPPGDGDEMFVVEMLPGDTFDTMPTMRETIQVRRLGRITLGPSGYRRVLRGVEAIRGFCIYGTALSVLTISFEGREIGRHPLLSRPLRGGLHKHAFNVWLDFSRLPRGRGLLELRFSGTPGRTREYRVAVEIDDPVQETEFPESDAIVDPPSTVDQSLTEAIASRASMIRSTARAPMSAKIETIYVQRIDQLGDLIVSLPALARLRELFPDAHLTLIASGANAGFAQTIEIVDEVIVVSTDVGPSGRRTVSRDAQTNLRGQLAHRRFDLAIDLGQGADTRPLLRLSGAPLTYGFRCSTTPWLSASFDLTAPDPADNLETCSPSRKLLAMIDAVGRLHDITATTVARDHPARTGDLSVDKPYLLLHAGARLEMNRWPYFDRLIELIRDRTEFDICLMGMEAVPSTAMGDRLWCKNGILPFAEFDALVSGASIFVGNDSGPKHLAAVRGVPTISLHLARLNWSEWGQEGFGSIISRRVPCAGCAIEQDPNECGREFACLRDIRPTEVMDEIVRLVGTGRP